MVKETLLGMTGTGQLSVSLRTTGRHIVENLSQSVEITAAFWSFQEEEETWRLFIATPVTDSEGPLYVYSQLQSVLKNLPSAEGSVESAEVELSDISVIGPNARIVGDLRRQYGAVPQEDNRRVWRTQGPYIYRLFE